MRTYPEITQPRKRQEAAQTILRQYRKMKEAQKALESAKYPSWEFDTTYSNLMFWKNRLSGYREALETVGG